MATELLNRSMDLRHEKRDKVHHLYFDCMYPTKIDGYIFKIFKATDSYKLGDTFSLHLDDEDILYMNNPMSFEGNIKSSDFFIENDCVLCVINVTEDRELGSVKLWNISRPAHTEEEDAIIFNYRCNGETDSYIIKNIIKVLQAAADDGQGITLESYGFSIPSDIRKVTNRIIFKFIGKFGLWTTAMWSNIDDELPDNRSRRLEYIHIESDTKIDGTDSYREDVFSYIFDFENCIIVKDSKQIIMKESSIINEDFGPRAFFLGLSGNSKATVTFRNLRYCKDYTGLVFVDGNNKNVIFENCLFTTNTFGGRIAPVIYGSYQMLKAYNVIGKELILGDSNGAEYADEIADQEYSTQLPFPVLVDNYSTTSTVTLKNCQVNPDNDGYSAMPHLIHNSGKISIENSIINFYNCIRYFDDNIHTTQSGTIYNEPRVIDLNSHEYDKYTIPTNPDTNLVSRFGTWKDYTRDKDNNIITLPIYDYDYKGYWSTINITNAYRPEIEISNSTIKQTRGNFISNLNGVVKIYNSKLEIVNKRKTVQYAYDSYVGQEKPRYNTAKYNRLIDSYGGQVYVKDNTLIADGPNIQLINMSMCTYNNKLISGGINSINNSYEMKFLFEDLLYPSMFIKLLAYNPDDFDANYEDTASTGNKIFLQNCTFNCEYSGSVEEFKLENDYTEHIEAAMSKLHISNDNAKYIAMYAHFKRHVRNHLSNWTNADVDRLLTFDLERIFGTVLLHNIGDNYIYIDNCNTSINGSDVSNSPMIGIYDQGTNKRGRLDITNSNIGSWCTCLSSILLPDIYFTSSDRNYAFAHPVNITNSKFINFFDYSNKEADEDRIIMMPLVYLETNREVNINKSYFSGNDVIINTDSSSKAFVDKCDFLNSKLLSNVYKDYIEANLSDSGGGGTISHNNLLARYNMCMNLREFNRRSRQSVDSFSVSNCSFSNTVNTSIRFMRDDQLHTRSNKIFTKDCVNRSNLIINSVKHVNVSNCTFDSTGNNILVYGQQSALAEYYLNNFKDSTKPVAPFFNFDVTLRDNTFKSVISTVDKYNIKAIENDIDDHFIASNVLIYGDTVNLNADSNEFIMASVDGGCNILSLSDERYCKYIDIVEQYAGHGDYKEKSIPSAQSVKIFNTIKNKINLYNNEFTSFAFGIEAGDSDSNGLSLKNIFWALHVGGRYMYESSSALENLFNARKEIIYAAYRAFNVGISNCNTELDVQNNKFCKSRGTNPASNINGTLALRTYATMDTVIFADKTSNDIFSGGGIYIETTHEPTGANEAPHFTVYGTFKNNVMGAQYGTGTGVAGVDDDDVIRLSMQGLIKRNTYKSDTDEFPNAFDEATNYYPSSDSEVSYTATVESNDCTTDVTLVTSNNTCHVDIPEYNYCSNGGYSFIQANKNIYR